MRIDLGVHEQAPAAEFLLHRVIHRQLRSGNDVLVVQVLSDADDAPAAGGDADELHHRVGPHQFAIHGIARVNMRRTTLSLTITTFSLSAWSSALKSRPAMIGTPSALKNPGDTVRKLARGSSSPLTFG